MSLLTNGSGPAADGAGDSASGSLIICLFVARPHTLPKPSIRDGEFHNWATSGGDPFFGGILRSSSHCTIWPCFSVSSHVSVSSALFLCRLFCALFSEGTAAQLS